MAHGQDAFVTVYFGLVTLLILIVATFAIKLTWKGKLIFFVIWILATVLTWIATDELPYDRNKALINFAVIVVPFVIAGLGYVVLKKRFKKPV